MRMQRFRVAPPSRRQLLRKALILAMGLAVARAVETKASQEIQIEEKDQPMPEIMHLIKIRAAQDRVYQAVSTAEDIRNWWTRDAALDPAVGGTGEFGFYGHRMSSTAILILVLCRLGGRFSLSMTQRAASGRGSSHGGIGGGFAKASVKRRSSQRGREGMS